MQPLKGNVNEATYRCVRYIILSAHVVDGLARCDKRVRQGIWHDSSCLYHPRHRHLQQPGKRRQWPSRIEIRASHLLLSSASVLDVRCRTSGAGASAIWWPSGLCQRAKRERSLNGSSAATAAKRGFGSPHMSRIRQGAIGHADVGGAESLRRTSILSATWACATVMS